MAGPRILNVFAPSPAQWALFERLQRFNVLVCHRGFGKTYLAVNVLIRQAVKRPGTHYAFIADTYRHAKEIAWDAVLKECLKEAADLGLVKFNEADLSATFANGSEIGLYSGESASTIRGLHLDGAVFDEYALQPPRVWEQIVFPALARKEGGAIFIGTPMGRNHFYSLYKHAQGDADWFAETVRATESGVFTPAQLEAFKRVQTPEEYAQEYECSFETAISGAYYARELAACRAAGRVRPVAWQPTVEVSTWWDLGHTDATVILFVQQVGQEIHVIDYVEDAGKDLSFYAKALQDRPYLYGRHHLPHDAGHSLLAAGGRSIADQLKALLHGKTPVRVHPKNDPLDGINQARLLFPRVWFDAVKAERLLDCLAYYHAKQDAKHQIEKPEPEHDWSSHAADAFRVMACGIRLAPAEDARTPPSKATLDFSPLDHVASGRTRATIPVGRAKLEFGV